MSTTPSASAPSWLEAAAKMDALTADRVPLGSARSAAAPEAKPRPRPDVAAPIVPKVSGEEVHLAWRGYDVWALLPSTVALGLVTAAVMMELRRLVPTAVVVETIYAPLAALWTGQVIRAAYRLFAYRYRLTSRRLFCERGRLYPQDVPLDLAMVARVEVKQTLLGVGTICVVSEEGSGRPAVELAGVRRPRVLAATIEQAVQAAREANVTTARVGLG